MEEEIILKEGYAVKAHDDRPFIEIMEQTPSEALARFERNADWKWEWYLKKGYTLIKIKIVQTEVVIPLQN